jgi:hypothetical protein
MNTKTIITIEIEKNGRKYAFHIPFGAPYGEAHDIAFEIAAEIIEMSKKALEQQIANKEKAKDIDEANPAKGE